MSKLGKLLNSVKYKMGFTPSNKYRLGLYGDAPDTRDLLKVSLSAKVNDSNLIEEFGVSSTVWNQGVTNSCAGHAGSTFFQILYSKLNGTSIKFSPWWLYYKARELDGETSTDEGTTLRNIMKSANQSGICPNYAYGTDTWKYIPREGETLLASKLKLKSYFRVFETDLDDTVEQMALILSEEKLPILIGVMVWKKAFDKASNGYLSGEVYDNDVLLGGHALVVYGYDSLNDNFLIQNSWGTSWGWFGSFEMSSEYLKANLMDAWTCSVDYY